MDLKRSFLQNGHGGNGSFLEYFCQSQLAGKTDYIVVLFQPGSDPARLRNKITQESHP